MVLLDSSKTKDMMQIVEQAKSFNTDEPDKAKYLSHSNQKVKEETRAAKTGRFQNTVGRGFDDSRSTETPSSLDKFKPKFKPADGSLPTRRAMAEQQKKIQKSGPMSQTDDHLPDVKQGLQTLLNTREFVYYSYYQRIRNQIRQFWEPSIREKVRKLFAQGRTIASATDRVTRVIIILDKNGKLINVQVVGKSGIRDLDDAAVEAFRAAEPFPNPPQGIVESDGTIRIRWDFILEA